MILDLNEQDREILVMSLRTQLAEGINIPDAAQALLERLQPTPAKQKYYVLYEVVWQPDAEDDAETNPPMDFQHELRMKDPRCTTYGMEQIGPAQAIKDWVEEKFE